MTVEPALLAFTLAAACHAGFQVTVTALVYPALARVPVEAWGDVHARHSRTITPVVGLLYGALLLAGGWATATGPPPAAVVALALAATCVAVTALVAAPTHGRLTTPDAALLARLLTADRARAGLAVASLVAAVLALSGR